MRILAIEAATNVASVALVDDTGILGEISNNTGKTHSQRLMPLIANLLEETDLKLKDLDGIAVSGGPGSFTGLRIGVSTAKALAYAAKLPLISVSTLESLSLNLKGGSSFICPILNARRNEVYTAIYQVDINGIIAEVMPKKALTPDALVLEIKEGSNKVIFLGDGVPIFGEYLLSELGELAELASPIDFLPRAANLGWLGLKKLKNGKIEDLATAKPLYIRPSEAELTWQQKKA